MVPDVDQWYPLPMPMASPSLRSRVRECTQERHHALDNALGECLTLDREAYVRFLKGSFVAASRLECAIEKFLGEGFECLRAELLGADLALLGVPLPSFGLMRAAYQLEGEASAWGHAYVIEGSALGGMVLAERVKARLGGTFPTRYLEHRGRETAVRWRWFLERFEDRKSTRLNSSHPVSSRMPSSA